MYSLLQSAPPGLYSYLALAFIGLAVWSFLWGYFLRRGRKRVLGLLLAFSPAITISAFLIDVIFSQPWQGFQHVLSIVSFPLAFYVPPAVIGYAASLLVARLRRRSIGRSMEGHDTNEGGDIEEPPSGVEGLNRST